MSYKVDEARSKPNSVDVAVRRRVMNNGRVNEMGLGRSLNKYAQ